MTAVVEVFLCRAIIKIASAIPNGFAFGRNLSASGAGFVKEELTGIAVDSAN